MIHKKKKYKLADFDYSLPLKFIAQYPSRRRDRSMIISSSMGVGSVIWISVIEPYRKNKKYSQTRALKIING